MADPVSQSPRRPAFGSIVRIDGKGRGILTAASYINNKVKYNVHIEGTGYHVQLSPSRVTEIPATMSTAPADKQTTEPAPTQSKRVKVDENDEPTAKSRFSTVTDGDIGDIIRKQANKNTLLKTFYDVKLLKLFLAEPDIAETRELHDIPPPALCNILAKFFIAAKKPDGTNYEPSSLRGFLSSFDRELRQNNYGHSLISDQQFAQVREVLKSKQKELKREGKGNLPNKTDAISDEDTELFWGTGQFGVATPDSMINTLWFNNTVHFGLRGAHEHRAMCWGDLELKTDSDGSEFLEFNERQTKTRPGDNPRDIRVVKPKMWNNTDNPTRCPVEIYKLYKSKRPSNYCDPDSPFYIATSTKNNVSEWDQWFKRQPIGEKKLTSIVKRMVADSGLQTPRKLSNHSARKHLMQKLTENQIPANEAIQISGHKNIQSVNNYSHLSMNKHRHISQMLNAPTPVKTGYLSQSDSSTQYRAIAPYPTLTTGTDIVRNPGPGNTFPSLTFSAPGPSTTCNSTDALSRSPIFDARHTSQSNSMLHVHGGIHSLFGGNMCGGSVQVHIHNNDDGKLQKGHDDTTLDSIP